MNHQASFVFALFFCFFLPSNLREMSLCEGALFFALAAVSFILSVYYGASAFLPLYQNYLIARGGGEAPWNCFISSLLLFSVQGCVVLKSVVSSLSRLFDDCRVCVLRSTYDEGRETAPKLSLFVLSQLCSLYYIRIHRYFRAVSTLVLTSPMPKKKRVAWNVSV